MKEYTLVYPILNNSLYLGKKKRGIGANYWNGFGGKVDQGETVLEACKRELFEESGIHSSHFIKVAEHFFSFQEQDLEMKVHTFVTHQFQGIPVETDEMKPSLFEFSAIPYREMWPSDKYWLPIVLSGETVKSSIHFEGTTKVLNWRIEKCLF